MNSILKELYSISEAPFDIYGHSARNSLLLVLLWCYKARSDREQDLWSYWVPESCIKQWCDKPAGYGCLSKKCELWVRWSSDLAVSRTLAKLSDIHSENPRFETLCFTPLTSISSDIAVRSLLPLLFLRSLSSPIINVCSCLQVLKLSWIGLLWSIFHMLGFISPNFLHICVMIIARLLKF